MGNSLKPNSRAINLMVRRINTGHQKGPSRTTRVMAKNLLPGDEFLLNGGYHGTIVTVSNRGERSDRITTTFAVVNENGKIFSRTVTGNLFVSIMEYPWTHEARRAMSRVPFKSRFTYNGE